MTESLIHRHTGKLDHLAPFLGLVGNQSAELLRRHRLRDAADGFQPLDQLGIFQRFGDGLVPIPDRSKSPASGSRK